MKQTKGYKTHLIRMLVLGGCFAVLTLGAASGPTNSWSQWRYKKLICGFTNALLVSMNGHAMPQFAPSMFDSATHLYLYSDVDGDVYGAGDASLLIDGYDAIMNIEVDGELSTKGSRPYLKFDLDGEGSGIVNGTACSAKIDAKYKQTQFVVYAAGGSSPEVYYSKGTISGKVTFSQGAVVRFTDEITILLDNVPAHFGDIAVLPQLRLDVVEIDGRRFSGHAHGTNNCFGRYYGAPDDVVVKGLYNPATGGLTMDIKGVGPNAGIKATMAATLEAAAPSAAIHVKNATMTARAFGQKCTSHGNGLVFESEP